MSIKTAARKLPIKRKSTEISPNFTPKFEISDQEDDDGGSLDDLKPPPFKFHRIWVESDEIRFLQGLLDSSSHGLIFPRDLNLFYDTFSLTMSQPYTKSQLSEKIRRLRRKFRAISTRIRDGFDYVRLSEHDKSLFEISKKLWDPEFNGESPFSSAKKKVSTRVSVEVSFNPDFTPSSSISSVPIPVHIEQENCGEEDDDEDCELEIIEKNDELSLKNENVEVKRMVMKTVMDVFDKSLSEVRMGIEGRDLSCHDHDTDCLKVGKDDDLMKRCKEQTIAELDVVARRIRLVLENPVCDQ